MPRLGARSMPSTTMDEKARAAEVDFDLGDDFLLIGGAECSAKPPAVQVRARRALIQIKTDHPTGCDRKRQLMNLPPIVPRASPMTNFITSEKVESNRRVAHHAAMPQPYGPLISL